LSRQYILFAIYKGCTIAYSYSYKNSQAAKVYLYSCCLLVFDRFSFPDKLYKTCQLQKKGLPRTNITEIYKKYTKKIKKDIKSNIYLE
jgi:hypothetical protein